MLTLLRDLEGAAAGEREARPPGRTPLALAAAAGRAAKAGSAAAAGHAEVAEALVWAMSFEELAAADDLGCSATNALCESGVPVTHEALQRAWVAAVGRSGWTWPRRMTTQFVKMLQNEKPWRMVDVSGERRRR